MRPFTRLSAAVLLVAVCIAPLPARYSKGAAQAAEAPSPTLAGVCMAAERPVPGEALPASIAIVVPEDQAGVMEEKGYAAGSCGSIFESVSEELRWRDQVCTMASTMPERVQGQLETLFGERPAVLCAMAELVLGPWDRTAGLSNGTDEGAAE